MNHFWILYKGKYEEVAESDIIYFLLDHLNEEVMIEERREDDTIHAWLISKECDYRIPEFFLLPQLSYQERLREYLDSVE
jgi:hypothetical protein